MSIPVVVLGTTVLWPTTGDTNYSSNTTQFVQLVASALDPIAGLYNTTTGLVGYLAYSNTGELTLNGVPVGTGTGSVTSVAATGTQGVSISGSPITTTGTITVGLGNITPTSVSASSTVVGSNITATNTSSTTVPFDFGDATPKNILLIASNKVVEEVSIVITTPFDDITATLSVGDINDINRFISTSDNVPSTAGTYSTQPGSKYIVLSQVTLTISAGTSTQGSGLVIIRYQS